jgi:hypothetical protein
MFVAVTQIRAYSPAIVCAPAVTVDCIIIIIIIYLF